jgi:hypothetical protein
MAAIVLGSDVDQYLRSFEAKKALRLPFDTVWQKVADYVLPRRDFSLPALPGQLRPRKVSSNVGINANRRMAAFLLTYAVDATRPFLLPSTKRGLLAAGRRSELDGPSLDYTQWLEWSIYDRMMLPRSGFMARLNSALLEFCAFGNCVLWVGRRRGFGPYYLVRPLRACWWSENEEGVIDNLYFLMTLPLYRVLDRWPAAKAVAGWEEKAKYRRDDETVQILHCVEPRAGGRYGAVVEAKPFKSITIALDKKVILDESGYDTFPFAVGRGDVEPGQAYAFGAGCAALPDIMVLNALQQDIEDAVALRVRPPLAVPARMFGRQLDRRPGAVNAFNNAGLGLSRADQAVIKLDVAGDPGLAAQYLAGLKQDIEMAFFVDWMRLRDTGNVTATEVNDRRDVRLRGMASIVAQFDPMMGTLADRTLETMTAEGQIPAPPQQLSGVDVDWEYAGPLAIAQLQGQVQALLQGINARQLVQAQDPAAAEAMDLEETLRAILEGLGAAPKIQVSREDVQHRREALAQRQADQQSAEQAKALAGAVGSGSSGIAALLNAGGGSDAAAVAEAA